jgi:hypothetical protein
MLDYPLLEWVVNYYLHLFKDKVLCVNEQLHMILSVINGIILTRVMSILLKLITFFCGKPKTRILVHIY